MLNLNSLLLFSEAPKKLIDFYRKVLALEPKWQVEEYTGFEVGACALVIGPHSQVHGQSKNPERIMFNFETKDVKGEFKRMKGLGAKEIAEPYHPDDDQDSWIATLAPGRELFPAHVAHENVDIAIRKANYHGHPSW